MRRHSLAIVRANNAEGFSASSNFRYSSCAFVSGETYRVMFMHVYLHVHVSMSRRDDYRNLSVIPSQNHKYDEAVERNRDEIEERRDSDRYCLETTHEAEGE